jgi:adenosylcobinamide kinase / adenosylcobinamide-phosphate guanylyltransferase
MARILVTGGIRSGKSAYAERRLAGESAVTYLAAGGPADPADTEWAARIAVHQLRRPAHWTTVETADLTGAVRSHHEPIMIDSLGSWLAATVDRFGTWDRPLSGWKDRFEAELAELIAAWRGHPGPAVAVTNEVGWGLVAEHRSGRTFADLLGHLNQEFAAASDELIMVVAGRALRL